MKKWCKGKRAGNRIVSACVLDCFAHLYKKKLQSAKKPYMFIATQSFQSSGGLLPCVHTQHLIIFPHTDKSFFLPDNGQYYYFTIMIVIIIIHSFYFNIKWTLLSGKLGGGMAWCSAKEVKKRKNKKSSKGEMPLHWKESTFFHFFKKWCWCWFFIWVWLLPTSYHHFI